jgi:hypothetical protein
LAAHDVLSTSYAVVTAVRYVVRVIRVATACRVSTFMNYRIIKLAAPVVLWFLVLRVALGHLGPFVIPPAAVLRVGTGRNRYIVRRVARITGYTCEYLRHFLRPSGFAFRRVDAATKNSAVGSVRQMAEATL